MCNTVMAIATDKVALKVAVGMEKSLLQKLGEALKRLVNKIKEFIGTRTSNEAAKAIMDDVKALERLAEMFAKGAESGKVQRMGMNTFEYKADDIQSRTQATRQAVEQTKYVDSEGREAGLKFSVDEITAQDIEMLRNLGRKSIYKLTHEDIAVTKKWAKKFYKELGVKSPFFRAWFGDWREADNSIAFVTRITGDKNLNKQSRTVVNTDTGWNINITASVFNDTLHYSKSEKSQILKLLNDIDSVVKNAVLFDTSVSEKLTHNKKGSTQFMHYLYSLIEYNGNPFLAKITVEEYGNETKRRAYNVERIKMSALSRAQYSQIKSVYRGSFASSADSVSVAELFDFVKTYDG